MAAVQLLKSVPRRVAVTTAQQAFTLPTTGAHGGFWVRIYSTADCYLIYAEAGAADGAALPAEYETIPGGTPTPVQLYGTTFAIAGSTSQTVEVTAR